MSRIRAKSSNETRLKQKTTFCKNHNRPVDDIERFWSYVDIQGLFDCWEWQGYVTPYGYGSCWINGKSKNPHRVAYQLYHGEIPDGKQVNHKCNKRKCCNPFHLYAGTSQENMDDKVNADRQAKGITHGSNKLTEKSVLEIRENKNNLTHRQLAILYGVKHSTIGDIHSYKLWKHI
jgi:hypothetical protein